MSAREEILARVGLPRPIEPVERGYRRTGALSAAERVELFCERVGEYRAEVRRVDDADDVLRRLLPREPARS